MKIRTRNFQFATPSLPPSLSQACQALLSLKSGLPLIFTISISAKRGLEQGQQPVACREGIGEG